MRKYVLQPQAFKVVSLDGARGEFAGYAAVFGNEDRVGDVIEPGAFAQTLQEATDRQRKAGSKILWPVLWMHDAENPIGGITSAKEDAKGLYVTGQLDLDTADGRKAFSAMDKGYGSQFSIGYTVARSSRDQAEVRHLLQINLGEISCVTTGFAANPEANVVASSVKTTKPGDDWRTRRPGFVPPRRSPNIPDPPDPEQFISPRAFHDAWDTWAGTYYGVDGRSRTVAHPDDPKDTHMVGVVPTTQSREEFEQDIEQGRDQRLASGTAATLADRASYYNQHGATPDGRVLDTAKYDEAILRGYQAIYNNQIPDEE